ncbi:MAG: hypothetical protein K6L80_08265 [Agarilytica sp.]
MTNKKLCKLLLLGAFGVFLSGCKTETLISNDILASSENAVYSKNGRFFVVGNATPESLLTKESAIYEITREGENYTTSSVVESTDYIVNGEPCQFRGITAYKNSVYAVCVYSVIGEIIGQTLPLPTHSILVKVDATKTANDEGYIETTQVFGSLISPNGMATDSDGNIFVSDSNAYLSTFAAGIPAAAILKVTPSFDGGLSTTYESWYPALPTDTFPNGIQILGDNLFYITGSKLQKFHLQPNGMAGTPVTMYEAEPCNIMDDFDISPIGLIATSEIRPTPEFDAIFFPGIVCDQLPHGKLVMLSGRIPNLVYDEYVFEATFPSSVRFTRGNLFEAPGVVVTDYFTGGLRLVTEE